jgi:glutamate synthase (ferredoxin)
MYRRTAGAPEDLVNYFHFIAEEVRAGLASLGLRSMNELIGRSDKLAQRDHPLAKTSGLDLSFLTSFAGETGSSTERLGQEVHDNGPQLDDRILADADVQVGGRVLC